jgi:hypothetical protein
MNKNKLNFWLDIVLVILVVAAMIALLMHEINRSAPNVPTWNLVREICGVLILGISALHLALHWNWIKAVVSRRTLNLAETVRHNRMTDLWLFGLAIPCIAAGIMVWTLPEILPAPVVLSLDHWRDLHNWAGTAMFTVIVIHLILHEVDCNLRTVLSFGECHTDRQRSSIKSDIRCFCYRNANIP